MFTKDQAATAQDELNMLNGKGRHNNPGNMCWGDAHFAASLVAKYGRSLEHLQEAIDQALGKAPALTPFDQAWEDIKYLLDQLGVEPSQQDQHGITVVRKRYGFNR